MDVSALFVTVLTPGRGIPPEAALTVRRPAVRGYDGAQTIPFHK